MDYSLSTLRTSVNGLRAGIIGSLNDINTDALSAQQCYHVKRTLLQIAQNLHAELSAMEEDVNEHP